MVSYMPCTLLTKWRMALLVDIVQSWAWPQQRNEFPVTAKEQEVQGKAVLVINITAKALYELYITIKMEHFSFKSGCAIWVVKHLI